MANDSDENRGKKVDRPGRTGRAGKTGKPDRAYKTGKTGKTGRKATERADNAGETVYDRLNKSLKPYEKTLEKKPDVAGA